MNDPNNTFSRNENDEMLSPTANGPEEGSMAMGQTNPNRASIAARRTISTQTDPDTSVHGTDQRNHRRARRISMHDPRRFLLGLAQPCPSDDIVNSNQQQHGNNGITHPTDEMWRMGTNDDILSTFTNVHTLDIRESTAVEDPRLPDMPPPVILNIVRFETTTNNEDNHPPVDHDTNTNSMDPTMTNAPAEYPHDIEFSEDTVESDSDHELVAESELRDRRAHADSPTINDSPVTNEDETSINPGDVTVNNEMGNRSNETNITIVRPNPTAMPQVSCSEASDSGPNVQASAGCANEGAGYSAPPSNLLTPKVPGVIDSGEESG